MLGKSFGFLRIWGTVLNIFFKEQNSIIAMNRALSKIFGSSGFKVQVDNLLQ